MQIIYRGKEHCNFIDRLGETHKNNQGCNFTIIEYFSKRNCTIQFEDGTILKNINYSNVTTGGIINPNHPSLYNIGYLGIGEYKRAQNGKNTPAYIKWSSMFTRCYNKKFQEKAVTYAECTVDERWHNFQVFAEWFYINHKEGFELDKDILIKDNKIYSPETCCFVPQEINKILNLSKASRGKYPLGVSKLGNKFLTQVHGLRYSRDTIEEAFEVYKTVKEKEIKASADKWKYVITEDIYKSLYNWVIEITD